MADCGATYSDDKFEFRASNEQHGNDQLCAEKHEHCHTENYEVRKSCVSVDHLPCDSIEFDVKTILPQPEQFASASDLSDSKDSLVSRLANKLSTQSIVNDMWTVPLDIWVKDSIA